MLEFHVLPTLTNVEFLGTTQSPADGFPETPQSPQVAFRP